MMKSIGIAIIALFLSVNSFAQVEIPKAEALFIYNFTKGISWPESSLKGEFVIGVVGDRDLYNELEVLTKNKNVGLNKISLKYYAKPSEIVSSHVLIVGDRYAGSFDQIKSSAGTFPTLFINTRDGMTAKGSGISFRLVDDKMKFVMSTSNIKNRGLQIDSRLEKMAILVD
jgi:hypothetical protein